MSYTYKRTTFENQGTRATISYLSHSDVSMSTASVYDMNNLPYMSQARSMLLLLCAIMFFTASCTFMYLGYIQADYNGKCFLYTEVHFELDKGIKNYSISSIRTSQDQKLKLKLSAVETKWGPTFDCNFTTYTPVMVAILSMVIAWSTFTVWPTMMEIGKGGVLMFVYAFFFAMCLGSCIASTVVLLTGYKKTCEILMTNEITCKSLNTDFVTLKADGEKPYINDIHKAMFIAGVASSTLIGLSSLQIILVLVTFGIIWFHFHIVTMETSHISSPDESSDDADFY